MEKVCRSCGRTRRSSEFYAHPYTADRLQADCKECHREKVRANRAAKADQYRAYEQSRAHLPHRIAARAEYAKTDAGKSAGNRAKRKWSQANAVRRAAQVILGNAVRDGKVVPWPACAMPECNKRPVGHHPDYDRPLEVVWLCQEHHKQAHSLVKGGEQ